MLRELCVFVQERLGEQRSSRRSDLNVGAELDLFADIAAAAWIASGATALCPEADDAPLAVPGARGGSNSGAHRQPPVRPALRPAAVRAVPAAVHAPSRH